MSGNCPVCGCEGVARTGGFENDIYSYDCPRCGRYRASDEALMTDDMRRLQTDHRDAGLLSGVIRRRQRKGHYVELRKDDQTVRGLLAAAPTTIEQRSLALLSWLVDHSPFLGSPIPLKLKEDSSLAYSKYPEEFKTFLLHLHSEGLITYTQGIEPIRTVVTPSGHEEVTRFRQENRESTTCFVAMRFAEDAFHSWRDGIAPAIHRAGFDPKRVDQEHFLDDVMDKVLTMIRQSRFVVADFTDQRNGVYYEAGFAKGIGLPVVMACHKSQIAQAHFDTNHLNHIAWETDADLQEKLYNRIVATIGQGPLDPGRAITWSK